MSRIITEDFPASDWYDSDWSGSIAGTGSEEYETGRPGDLPGDTSPTIYEVNTNCWRLFSCKAGEEKSIVHDHGSSVPISYVRIYPRITNTSANAPLDASVICELQDSSGANCMKVILKRVAQNDDNLISVYFHDGSPTEADTLVDMAPLSYPSDWYLIEFLYDSTNGIVQTWVNGTSKFKDTGVSGMKTPQKLEIGYFNLTGTNGLDRGEVHIAHVAWNQGSADDTAGYSDRCGACVEYPIKIRHLDAALSTSVGWSETVGDDLEYNSGTGESYYYPTASDQAGTDGLVMATLADFNYGEILTLQHYFMANQYNATKRHIAAGLQVGASHFWLGEDLYGQTSVWNKPDLLLGIPLKSSESEYYSCDWPLNPNTLAQWYPDIVTNVSMRFRGLDGSGKDLQGGRVYETWCNILVGPPDGAYLTHMRIGAQRGESTASAGDGEVKILCITDKAAKVRIAYGLDDGTYGVDGVKNTTDPDSPESGVTVTSDPASNNSTAANDYCVTITISDLTYGAGSNTYYFNVFVNGYSVYEYEATDCDATEYAYEPLSTLPSRLCWPPEDVFAAFDMLISSDRHQTMPSETLHENIMGVGGLSPVGEFNSGDEYHIDSDRLITQNPNPNDLDPAPPRRQHGTAAHDWYARKCRGWHLPNKHYWDAKDSVISTTKMCTSDHDGPASKGDKQGHHCRMDITDGDLVTWRSEDLGDTIAHHVRLELEDPDLNGRGFYGIANPSTIIFNAVDGQYIPPLMTNDFAVRISDSGSGNDGTYWGSVLRMDNFARGDELTIESITDDGGGGIKNKINCHLGGVSPEWANDLLNTLYLVITSGDAAGHMYRVDDTTLGEFLTLAQRHNLDTDGVDVDDTCRIYGVMIIEVYPRLSADEQGVASSNGVHLEFFAPRGYNYHRGFKRYNPHYDLYAPVAGFELDNLSGQATGGSASTLVDASPAEFQISYDNLTGTFTAGASVSWDSGEGAWDDGTDTGTILDYDSANTRMIIRIDTGKTAPVDDDEIRVDASNHCLQNGAIAFPTYSAYGIYNGMVVYYFSDTVPYTDEDDLDFAWGVVLSVSGTTITLAADRNGDYLLPADADGSHDPQAHEVINNDYYEIKRQFLMQTAWYGTTKSVSEDLRSKSDLRDFPNRGHHGADFWDGTREHAVTKVGGSPTTDADAEAAGEMHDAGGDFINNGVVKGDVVHNTTDDKWFVVKSVVSGTELATELTYLDPDQTPAPIADTIGDSDAYTIFESAGSDHGSVAADVNAGHVQREAFIAAINDSNADRVVILSETVETGEGVDDGSGRFNEYDLFPEIDPLYCGVRCLESRFSDYNKICVGGDQHFGTLNDGTQSEPEQPPWPTMQIAFDFGIYLDYYQHTPDNDVWFVDGKFAGWGRDKYGNTWSEGVVGVLKVAADGDMICSLYGPDGSIIDNDTEATGSDTVYKVAGIAGDPSVLTVEEDIGGGNPGWDEDEWNGYTIIGEPGGDMAGLEFVVVDADVDGEAMTLLADHSATISVNDTFKIYKRMWLDNDGGEAIEMLGELTMELSFGVTRLIDETFDPDGGIDDDWDDDNTKQPYWRDM